MLELAILLPNSLKKPETKLRMLLYLHFTSECHQNVCYFKSVSIVLKLAFWVTKQLHPPQIAECYYCSKKCAALSVSNLELDY